MAIAGGVGDGVFAAVVDNDNAMVMVAIIASDNGGSGDGHPCCGLRQQLMAAPEMATLAVAASAVDGGGGNGGLCRRWLLSTEAGV
jgi:hypothetical protein